MALPVALRLPLFILAEVLVVGFFVVLAWVGLQVVVLLEGDEYDSAFFAKWPKFHSYRPDIVIVTSLEFDHGDIYRSIEEIEDEFTKLIRRIPAGGTALVCDSWPRLIALAGKWRTDPQIHAAPTPGVRRWRKATRSLRWPAVFVASCHGFARLCPDWLPLGKQIDCLRS